MNSSRVLGAGACSGAQVSLYSSNNSSAIRWRHAGSERRAHSSISTSDWSNRSMFVVGPDLYGREGKELRDRPRGATDILGFPFPYFGHTFPLFLSVFVKNALLMKPSPAPTSL